LKREANLWVVKCKPFLLHLFLLVLGIDGAVCTNFVAFMLPTAFFLKVQSKPADPSLDAVAMLSPRNALDAVVFVLGVISLVLSTYQVIQRASGN